MNPTPTGSLKNMVVAEAPGRVEVLGNHTDYNEGLVLLSTVGLKTTVSGQKEDGNKVYLHSRNLDATTEFEIDYLQKDPASSWADYPKGVIQQLQNKGCEITGFRAEIFSTIPFGVGLSSSAALELSVALFLKALFGLEVSRRTLVELCQRAENEFVGVACGILDQFSSAFGKHQSLIFLDCRDLSFEAMPLSEDVSLVICDSGTRRSLVSSDYNRRRTECQKARDFFAGKKSGIKALRDVTTGDFQRYGSEIENLGLRKRAEHVIFENERVQAGREALREGRLEELGSLMFMSHQSSRTLFENSLPEIDFLVEKAYSLPGIIGAKLSGAGWGGATVNLVYADKAEAFSEALKAAYQEKFSHQAKTYTCSIPDGAAIVNQNNTKCYPE